MSTVQENLDQGNANTLPDMARKVQLGQIVAGLIPREIVRTGLASLTTHVEPEAGVILALSDGTDTYTVATSDGTVATAKGALATGIARVTYDAEGVASIEFEGNKTAYTVVKMVLPTGLAGNGLGAELAADSGGAT